MSRTFQMKRGNREDLSVLAEGEMGFAVDTGEFFVGNGTDNIEYAKKESLKQHEDDMQCHISGEERESWNDAVDKVKLALEKVDEVMIKASKNEVIIATLELAIYSNIVDNPFVVMFDSMDSIKVIKGIWNKEKQRVEC